MLRETLSIPTVGTRAPPAHVPPSWRPAPREPRQARHVPGRRYEHRDGNSGWDGAESSFPFSAPPRETGESGRAMIGDGQAPRAHPHKDHPAIPVELAFINALAADKGEIDRPWIVRQPRGDRPADAATVPLSMGEAVPIDARRLVMTDQHAHRPIGFREGRLPGNEPSSNQKSGSPDRNEAENRFSDVR